MTLEQDDVEVIRAQLGDVQRGLKIMGCAKRWA